MVLFFLIPSARAAAPEGFKKVLILFPSGGWSVPAHRMIYNGLKAVLDQSPHHNVVLLGDNLDLPFAAEVDKQRKLADHFRTKYAGENIDVVVPVTPAALDFVSRYRETMFPGLPIVFCMHSAYELNRLDRGGNITGVAITVDIPGTIELARGIIPNLKRLAVVAGVGHTDLKLTALARDRFSRDYRGRLEWIDLTGLHMPDLLEQVARLPEGTAILYLSIGKDGSGRGYVPAEALQLVSKSANAPVFSIFDPNLGYGTVGGRMTTTEAYGRTAGEIVRRILAGAEAAAIAPVVMSDSPPMFDWREMRRWRIEESDIPPGSVVLFKERSPLDLYKWPIAGTLAFILLQSGLIATLLRNIKKRKKAEYALTESEANLKKSQNIGQIGSFSLDILKQKVTWSVGANELCGIKAEDMPDLRSFLGIVHPADRKWVERRWIAALEGEPYDIEYRILVDGAVKWVRVKIDIESDPQGRTQNGMGIIQDITSRKLSEEEVSLLHQEVTHVSRVAMVGELGQTLAHEINQPLTAILVNAEAALQFMKKEPPDLAEVQAALADIVLDDRRAREVVQRIRSLVKKEPVTRVPVDLNTVARDAAEMVGMNAKKQGVLLRLDLDPGLSPITGDPVQLQQVVLNLLVNGLEAMPQKDSAPKHLTITTAMEAAGLVTLSVSDTGVGIEAQAMARLYEPFYTTKAQGLGLGLAISRSIVEAHGGSIGAASNLSRGAIFHFSLPVAQAASHP